jgi:MoaA/NifB/PqqE/SkfB family radical SAM enzyme
MGMGMIKTVRSKDYNYVFNTKTGSFARWGKDLDDDPVYSPFGPEILDIEISEMCHAGCSFCYKSNVPEGDYMSIDTYKEILDKIPLNLTQIAFGIGSLNACPDLYPIMEYTKKRGIIPNITINGYGLTNEHAKKLSELCGGIAVSHYDDDVCYNAVQKLKSFGAKQVNIHQLFSMETISSCHKVMQDYIEDKRLQGLNAIVFLLLKPKGDRNVFHTIKDLQYYKDIIQFGYENNIPFGFDSCSAPHFVEAVKQTIKDPQDVERFIMHAEPCESTRFSLYIDVRGNAWPCSFCEGHESPDINHVNVLEANDFLKDVWFSPEFVKFRKMLYESRDCNECENCPAFDLGVNT